VSTTCTRYLGVLGVDEGGEVTTVIKDEVELLAILEGLELLVQAPPPRITPPPPLPPPVSLCKFRFFPKSFEGFV
jgi:hypothetical protein